jgi:hypothetical protein
MQSLIRTPGFDSTLSWDKLQVSVISGHRELFLGCLNRPLRISHWRGYRHRCCGLRLCVTTLIAQVATLSKYGPEYGVLSDFFFCATYFFDCFRVSGFSLLDFDFWYTQTGQAGISFSFNISLVFLYKIDEHCFCFFDTHCNIAIINVSWRHASFLSGVTCLTFSRSNGAPTGSTGSHVQIYRIQNCKYQLTSNFQ